MNTKRTTSIQRGSGNVFADLKFPDPETHLLKAELAVRLSDVLKERGLTQTETAELTDMSQPDISRLLRGQFRDISVERIMRMLVKLGCSVDIVVKPAGTKARARPIHLEPAQGAG